RGRPALRGDEAVDTDGEVPDLLAIFWSPTAMRLPGLTRTLLIALMSAVTQAGAYSEEMTVIGHVLDVQGDWLIFDAGADEDAGRRLQKWQRVRAGGVIRVKSPTTGDQISIVDRDLKVIASRNCRVLATCYQPLFLPAAPHEANFIKEALGSVWEILWDESYR